MPRVGSERMSNPLRRFRIVLHSDIRDARKGFDTDEQPIHLHPIKVFLGGYAIKARNARGRDFTRQFRFWSATHDFSNRRVIVEHPCYCLIYIYIYIIIFHIYIYMKYNFHTRKQQPALISKRKLNAALSGAPFLWEVKDNNRASLRRALGL